jgi:hypothetical protein
MDLGRSASVLAKLSSSGNYLAIDRQSPRLLDGARKPLALDLKNAVFLSLPAIQFLAGTAKLLSAKGGALSVIAPNDRIKKHLETFATFKDMSCLASFSELDLGQWVKTPTSNAF